MDGTRLRMAISGSPAAYSGYDTAAYGVPVCAARLWGLLCVDYFEKMHIPEQCGRLVTHSWSRKPLKLGNIGQL